MRERCQGCCEGCCEGSGAFCGSSCPCACDPAALPLPPSPRLSPWPGPSAVQNSRCLCPGCRSGRRRKDRDQGEKGQAPLQLLLGPPHPPGLAAPRGWYLAATVLLELLQSSDVALGQIHDVDVISDSCGDAEGEGRAWGAARALGIPNSTRPMTHPFHRLSCSHSQRRSGIPGAPLPPAQRDSPITLCPFPINP